MGERFVPIRPRIRPGRSVGEACLRPAALLGLIHPAVRNHHQAVGSFAIVRTQRVPDTGTDLDGRPAVDRDRRGKRGTDLVRNQRQIASRADTANDAAASIAPVGGR